ncbi:MAG: polysaccharide ABC transporter ATP-binding protein, partial [Candidatus Shapirobacteria bacterium]|nr:polysaccharide ABC transporter ATP-binding protein [Candidatus Shapirobacteria bacterium]
AHKNIEEFWALKNISFEVQQGERIGIIGRNGAGKSTLLKILSRITEPTTGRVSIKGRVASLLEVGTGFHPELTGRENIYLNGAILGMTRREIKAKFDEIVAFAEVEKFLDIPVKRYSSGMYVRLAFAVAAHLEPEILVIDEVLAVGDAQFQKKCLGKMEEVEKEGRTVLFVSHSMQAIRGLCQRAILIEAGTVVADGKSDEVIQCYLQVIPKAKTPELLEMMIRQLPFDPAFRLESVRLLQSGLPVTSSISNGEPLEIEVSYQVLERTIGLRVFFDLYDNENSLLFRSFNDEYAEGAPIVEPGRYVSRAVITADLLAPTNYELRILATVFNVRMCIPYPGICIPLYVERTGKSNRAYMIEPIRGKLAPVFNWTTNCLGGL